MRERVRNFVAGLGIVALCSVSIWGLFKYSVYVPWTLSRDGRTAVGVVTQSQSFSHIAAGRMIQDNMHEIEYDGHTQRFGLPELYPVGSQIPILYSASHPDIAEPFPSGRTFTELAAQGIHIGSVFGLLLFIVAVSWGYTFAYSFLKSAFKGR